MGSQNDAFQVDSISYHSDLLAHKRLVAHYLSRTVSALVERAVQHDDSKFLAEEYDAYREAMPRFAKVSYGTEEYKEVVASLGASLHHHVAVNRHHPEHFRDGVNGMTLVDLVEMVCDWVAASQRHPGSALRLDIEGERFGIDDQLLGIIHHTIDFLQGVE